MTEAELEARIRELIPRSRDVVTAVPVRVLVFEAKVLADAAKKHAAAFAALPDFDPSLIDDLPMFADWLERKERAWQAKRQEKVESSLAPIRKEAEEFRSNVIVAGRYLLRKNAAAILEINEIADGSGIEDLVADLKRAAFIAETFGEKLAVDSKLPKDIPSYARSMAERLSKAVDHSAANEALAERNAAYFIVDEAAGEIREAARFLFRDDPKSLAPFVSHYWTRMKRRARKSAEAATAELPPM